MIVPATFVIDNLNDKRFRLVDNIVKHNVALSYRLMCYKKLSNVEVNNLFINFFILNECNFDMMNQKQKLDFLTSNE